MIFREKVNRFSCRAERFSLQLPHTSNISSSYTRFFLFRSLSHYLQIWLNHSNRSLLQTLSYTAKKTLKDHFNSIASISDHTCALQTAIHFQSQVRQIALGSWAAALFPACWSVFMCLCDTSGLSGTTVGLLWCQDGTVETWRVPPCRRVVQTRFT